MIQDKGCDKKNYFNQIGKLKMGRGEEGGRGGGKCFLFVFQLLSKIFSFPKTR